MASTSGAAGSFARLREGAPLVAFVLGALCLLAMVPVTLGALAGYLAIGAAVPALGATMTVSLLSLLAA